MRPTLLEANGALLFAAMGCAVLQIVRILLPAQWSLMEAAPLWDALQGALLIGLGLRLCARIKPSARERMLRLESSPTIAQAVLCIVAIAAGVLFKDDLTLLTGACMQRLGFDVSRQIAAGSEAPRELYALRVVLSGVVPAVACGIFYHAGQMAAWERRGTRYAVMTTAVLSALMCGSCVMLPAHLAIALASGAVMTGTGSIFMAVFLQAGVFVAGTAARQAQAGFGMSAARYGRLWAEVGGREGAGLLALETLLLGLVFYFLIRGVCGARPADSVPWKMRNARSRQMGAANIFVLSAAVVTGLCILGLDLMQMAGLL